LLFSNDKINFWSFQTTYEELKQENIKRLKGGDNSFQTTYEELKRAKYPPAVQKQTRFQTTYEELKPKNTGN